MSFFIIGCLISTAMQGLNNISVVSMLNIVIAVSIISVMRNFKDSTKATNIFILASVINLLIVLFSSMGFTPIIENVKGEPGGLLGNAPRLCYYLAITMPFVVEKFPLSAIIYIFLSLIFKEIYVSVFAIFFIVKNIHLERRYAYTISLIAFFVLTFFFFKHISHALSARWSVWEPTIAQAFSKPLFGHGLTVFPFVSEQFIHIIGYKVANAFSSFIQFFFACGIAGLIGLTLTISKIGIKFPLKAAAYSLIILALLSIFEYPFEVPKLWPTICFIIAMHLNDTEGSITCS